jgi:hypothetical protein
VTCADATDGERRDDRKVDQPANFLPSSTQRLRPRRWWRTPPSIHVYGIYGHRTVKTRVLFVPFARVDTTR